MLAEPSEIYDELICPKTGQKLEYRDDKLVSSESKIEYGLIDKQPLLINFDTSLFDKNTLNNKLIHRRKSNPINRLIKAVISPEKKITRENVSYIKNVLLKEISKPKVLIIGGGTIGQGMSELYDDKNFKLYAFDIYSSPNIQFLADAHNIPLPNQHFDLVVIQAVLEHVLHPEKVISEILRTLKASGIVYAETPFLQHVHEGAYDFTRFTESGHRYLFKDFSLIKSGASAGSGTQLLWSIDYFFRGLFRSNKAGKFFKLLFFWLRYFDQIIPEKYNIDAASGVFFLGKKMEKKLETSTIVDHYNGAQ